MTVIRLDRELLVLPVLNAVAAIIFALLLWLVASGLGVDLSVRIQLLTVEAKALSSSWSLDF